MLKVTLLAVTVLAAALIALVGAPTAHAYGFCPGDDVVVNVYQTVLNDVDVGIAGNAWASTSYTRNLVIVRTGPQSFCAYSTLGGKFVTNAGVSPGATGTVGQGLTGSVTGRWKTGTFWGTFRPSAPTRGFIGTVDYGCDASFACAGFVDWRSLYFRDTFGTNLVMWTYGFNGGEHGLFVRRNDPYFVGTGGDITG